jgi:hypothetical protein
VFGFDVYRWFGTGWIAANVAFGIAVTPLMVWLVRRLDTDVRREGIVGALVDDIAGRRLLEAMTRLDEAWPLKTKCRGRREDAEAGYATATPLDEAAMVPVRGFEPRSRG